MAVLMDATGGGEGKMEAVVQVRKGTIMHERFRGTTVLGVRG